MISKWKVAHGAADDGNMRNSGGGANVPLKGLKFEYFKFMKKVFKKLLKLLSILKLFESI